MENMEMENGCKYIKASFILIVGGCGELGGFVECNG